MMKDVIILLFFAGLYSVWFVSMMQRNRKIFFTILLALTVFHDYIFINVGYIASPAITYIVKSWQEYLLLILLAIFFGRNRSFVNRHTFVIIIFLMVLTMWGVLAGMKNKNALFDIYLSWRSYILPLGLCVMLLITGLFTGLNYDYFINVVVFLGLISVAAAFHQITLFGQFDLVEIHPDDTQSFIDKGGEVLRNFWFFEKFGEVHMLGSWPNFIRNGSVRATSFFVSPIAFSEFLAFPVLLLFGRMILLKRFFNKTRGFFLLLLLAGSYLTYTRIGMLIVMLGLLFMLLLTQRKMAADIMWSVLAGVIGAVFLLLIVFRIGDESAQGRLGQYVEMIKTFSLIGYGFGSEQVTAMYDSLYISVILLFGAASVFYFILHGHILNRIFTAFKKLTYADPTNLIMLTALALALSFSFAFVFQYSLSSSTILLMYLIFFIALNYVRSDTTLSD